jgi:UDP-N-acetylglucosamine/UDP-N-acetylgalactosamine diphosphorylase
LRGRSFRDLSAPQTIYFPLLSTTHKALRPVIPFGPLPQCQLVSEGSTSACAVSTEGLNRLFPSFPALLTLSIASNADPARMDAIAERLAAHGQQHLLTGFDGLEAPAQASFLRQLDTLDFDHLRQIFQASMANASATVQPAEPADDAVLTLPDATPERRATWHSIGLNMVAEGKLGILLLAGGQGTRLGSSAPKGCYNIGLPSRKSLFQLQAERVLRLQQLAVAEVPGATVPALRWYIMTSPATDAETRRHFANNAHFGLRPDQVFFFSQGTLPAMTTDGHVVLESPGRLAMAPDGNGGIYAALTSSGALADMQNRGIEALDCYCVDNALARLGDPVFVGFCRQAGAQLGARVVAKAHPEERVGVFARRGGALEVVEYSELDPAKAAAADPATGRLLYNWSNICMHYFSVSWLAAAAAALAQAGKYHVAHKKIPSIDGPVDGIKLELFIFDSFSTAENTVLMEVRREDEFAPVKNAPGSATDSPDTARAATLALHRKWIEAAGGRVEAKGPGVEVSPLVSYAGEGLNGLADRAFRDAYDVHLQGFLPAAVLGSAAFAASQYQSPRPMPSFKAGGRRGFDVSAACGLA